MNKILLQTTLASLALMPFSTCPLAMEEDESVFYQSGSSTAGNGAQTQVNDRQDIPHFFSNGSILTDTIFGSVAAPTNPITTDARLGVPPEGISPEDWKAIQAVMREDTEPTPSAQIPTQAPRAGLSQEEQDMIASLEVFKKVQFGKYDHFDKMLENEDFKTQCIKLHNRYKAFMKVKEDTLTNKYSDRFLLGAMQASVQDPYDDLYRAITAQFFTASHHGEAIQPN